MFEEINRRCFFIAKAMTRSRIYKLLLAGFVITIVCSSTVGIRGQSADPTSEPGAAGEPYPNMPSIAPIGVRIAKYLDVPASAQGPAIDPAKGYRVQDLGSGLYMITDNAIQSMFLVYDRGVVVIDAPQNLAVYIPKAIAELTNNPITHLIYSHSHADHIGGAKALGGHPIIIAHEETLRLLKRDADPNRPLPTVTFSNNYTLRVGKQVLDLSYHGNAHEPGNIFIYAPAQRVLMVVNNDVKQAAATALATTKPGEGLNPLDKNNPWAFFDHYIDRVAAQCVNTLTPKWSTKLGGFDVYVWDQCYSMEQTLRIE